MTEGQFIEITSRMEKYYEKELNQEQRRFWFENLKNMPVENYRKISYELMKNCKYLPRYADVQEIIKNTKFDERNIQKEKVYEKCNICGGTGLIKFYQKQQNGDEIINFEYLARCSCRNSQNYDWKDKEGNYIIPDARELNLI